MAEAPEFCLRLKNLRPCRTGPRKMRTCAPWLADEKNKGRVARHDAIGAVLQDFVCHFVSLSSRVRKQQEIKSRWPVAQSRVHPCSRMKAGCSPRACAAKCKLNPKAISKQLN